MKIRSKTLKLLIGTVLLSAGTTLFGQTNFTWNGPSGGGDLAGSTNWSPIGVPSGTDTGLGGLGDVLIFNGLTSGPVKATSNTGAQTGFSGQAWGLDIHMMANQINTVTLYTTLAISSGIRVNNITNDPGSASLILGDNTVNAIDTVWGGATSQIHEWLNNSTSPTIINPNLRLRYGGGGAHTLTFDGTGDWHVTNSLITANNSGTIVTMQGTGTMYWTFTNVPNDQINSSIQNPVTITSGTMVLNNSAIFGPTGVGPRTITDNSLLKYDDVNPSGSGTLSGTISGTGAIQVNSGTLTISSGLSTYSGSNILSGGELIAGVAETPGSSGPLGVGGTISFTGGTLGFSINNQFDYSPRFDTKANQAFNIDTGGQNVTFATPLASSGGSFNKLGAGTLTLAGTNTYTGSTTVSAGKLELTGGNGAGAISIANSAVLGVTEIGPQITPATLTVGTTGSASLEFNNVTSTTTPAIAAGSVSAAGGPIQINVASGSFLVGNQYPLFSWSSGGPPAVTLANLTGGVGNLATNGNSIVLVITGLAYVWTGNNNVDWDISTLNNWKVNGVAQIFANGGAALLDDTATSANTNIVLNSPVSPAITTVNSTTVPYGIASSGANVIGGSGGLVKNGNSILPLSGGANTYTGPTTISGGTVTVGALANGGAASDIGASANSAANLVLNGGTLQYTGGGATIDRLFTVSTFGGTIDNEGGQLALNNNGSIGLSGTGARSLTLTGNDSSGDTLAATLGDNGGATKLNKLGAGTWVVTGNNTYSGLTTISGGTLQVGAAGSTGSLGTGNVNDNSTLDVNETGTVTINTVNGNGAVTMDGSGTLVLPGNNGFTGALTINAGAVQVGNGGATGSLYNNVAITDNGVLIFNTTSQFSYIQPLAGSGNLIVRGAGDLTSFIGNNTYTGWTEIDPGATFEPSQGNSGALASSVVTNNGTLLLERQDNQVFIYSGQIVGTGNLVKENNNFNSGDCTLTGSNSYTGGTIIAGGGLILGDNSTAGGGAFPGDVVFTNSSVDDRGGRFLTFNRPDSFTFSNNIVGNTVLVAGQGNRGQVNHEGSGTLTFTGTNTYNGGTTVSNGTLIVAGPSASLGTGPVTIGSTLILSNTASLSIPGNINGGGTLVQGGSGTTTLGGINTNIVLQQLTINGPLVASNGTLVASSAGGDVDVAGGAFAPGGLGTAGTLTVAGGNVNISAGTFLATLNKSATQSNSFVQMTASGQLIDTNALTTNIVNAGTITYTGGTLVLSNIGPTLAVGDRFVLFSQKVVGGGAMPITLPGGYTFNNNLASDGSITVATAPVVNVPPLIKSVTLSGTNLIISATNNTGPGGTYHLLGTNNIASPLTNWPVISTGSFDGTGNVSLTNPATGSREFYILQVP